MIATSHDRSFYLTVRDPKNRTSKTVTLKARGLSAARIIRLVLRAVREPQRKAC
jgi:hypothetical protein